MAAAWPKSWRRAPRASPAEHGASPRWRVVLALVAGLAIGAGTASGIAAALWPEGRQPSTGSVLIDAPAVRTGSFLVQGRELRCGLSEIVGTHAEYFSKQGQFCRVRVKISVDDRAEDTWDSQIQQIAWADGAQTSTSTDAMHVKRQPLQFSLGGQASLEIDLWFDVPRTAQPTKLVVHAAAADSGTAIPLPRHTWPFGAAG
jgi:hypothetical protein